MNIFISHSSKDANIATELCNLIEASGSQCFLAPRNIRSGFEYAAEIVNGIDNSDAMLLLLSENSNSSPHILREIERAVSKSIPIIVYKLEDVVLSKSLEYFLMTHQWLNAEYGTHEQLLRCLRDMENNTSTSIPVGAVTNIQPKLNKTIPFFIALASFIVVALLVVFFLISSNSTDDKENNTTNMVAENTTPTTNNEKQTSEVATTTIENNSTDNTEQNTSEVATENPDNNNNYKDIALGDTIVFGKYNDADIYWKVIKKSEDGKEAVLISQKLLTFKAFSAAESGRCHYDENGKSYISSEWNLLEKDLELQVKVRGNSNWSTSTIRTWLNSDKDIVQYSGQIPTASAMSDRKNGYHTEPGFLYNFTDEELSAIKDTTVETKGNELAKNEIITTTDKVFLLSIDELKWLDEANVPIHTFPTTQAIEKNESFWYKNVCQNYYYTDNCLWWLREPVDGKASECYVVSYDSNSPKPYYEFMVAVEDFGIRPAITVDLTSNCIKVEK